MFYYASTLRKPSPKLHVTPGLFHRPQESSLVSIIQTTSEILFPPLSFWLIGKEVAISRCRAIPITLSPPDSVPRALIPLGTGSLFWRFLFYLESSVWKDKCRTVEVSLIWKYGISFFLRICISYSYFTIEETVTASPDQTFYIWSNGRSQTGSP